MTSQSAQFPVIFQVNENIIGQLPLFLQRNDMAFRNILVVSGETHSFKYAQQILNSLRAESFLVRSNDIGTVLGLKEFCLSNDIDLLVGVGGGTVLDVVKRVSLLTDINNILVPTIIANDGIVSPISVIDDENGQSVSLPGKMPCGIMVDIDIIQNAPSRFLQAAAGDILSNISATNDWVLSSIETGEPINDVAYMLSRSAAYALIHHESKEIRNRSFLKQVIYCQLNSGLAMSLAGTSRPCSGSEHLLSHAIDFHKISENTLHGYQVGSISIFCLYLQKKLDAKCINYAHELSIPMAFHQLNPDIIEQLGLIFETSFRMRPGRFTVLETYRHRQFQEVYEEYLYFLERFKIFDKSFHSLQAS